LKSCQNLFHTEIPNVNFISTGNQKADEIIKKSFLSNESHCILNFTFQEIFNKVWSRIKSIENINTQNEIIKILIQEIIESEDKCFLGKVTRIINSLSGFFNDIHINIPESEQILARIQMVIKNTNGHFDKQMIYKSLKELDIEDNIINEWIEHYHLHYFTLV
jgi:hypothetical protein